MRAALMQGIDAPVVIEHLTAAEPGPQDVVVRIEATGVCHSDISAVRGYIGLTPPAILGHEAAGVVEFVGAAVAHVKQGQRVIASLVPTCQRCYWCTNGQTHLCEDTVRMRKLTRAFRDDGTPVTSMLGLGAFADRMTVDQSQIVPVDSDLPAAQLALIGCGVATGAGAAMFTTPVTPGSTVAVIGCGGVGQAIIQGARLMGATTIVAVDPVDLKRAAGLTSGATHVVDPDTVSASSAVRDLTSGRGADFAFEAVGSPATVSVAYECARRGGQVATVGIPAPSARLDLPASDFFRAEKRVVGSYYGSTQVRRDFQRFADLAAAGRLDLAGLITRTYKLEELETAFDDLTSSRLIRGMVVH
ncbi:Zn-dependent alcohol dehydrogenase [Streptomyces sp. NPDC087856]|uniref:Zn-dependent alcohol dehydrogenase n=1 Tax=Streptomyces sp. NPDC087856 TaxID=3365811 RepID=UPI0037FED0F3